MKRIKYQFLAILLSAGTALADGVPMEHGAARPALTGAEKVGADAAVADHRLPPVFPGEEVRDGKNKIKTWSTSGPVPVGRAPEPWRDENNYGLNFNSGIGIVVDGRSPTGTSQGHK